MYLAYASPEGQQDVRIVIARFDSVRGRRRMMERGNRCCILMKRVMMMWKVLESKHRREWLRSRSMILFAEPVHS